MVTILEITVALHVVILVGESMVMVYSTVEYDMNYKMPAQRNELFI